MKTSLILFILGFPFFAFPQIKINGTVKDNKGSPVFAANIYLKSNPQKGVTSDFNGNFSLNINSINDTIIVSFIGYKTKEVLIANVDITKKINIILEESYQTLFEVIITEKDPISEQFSVVKLKKLDIYLDPVSQADPLKAITALPASTTTNETANPSLRGSAPDRSRVILNGVPIYKPVRASQLNNQGFFSLFNTEIINKQYVYASNPPLNYGNTSAGLVEIQTINNLDVNQLQVSAGLANSGLFLSQKIKRDTSFIQVYGNFQFSDAYVNIHKEKLQNTKEFYTKDIGINFYSKVGKKCEFNSYSYYIDESFNGYNQSFTYKGDVTTLNKRAFTVNNFKYYFKKGLLTINSGANRSKGNFKFGNISSVQNTNQVYSSIDYKWNLLENTKLQFGTSHDYHSNIFNDSVPLYYYALFPHSPNYHLKTSVHNHILEAYLFTNWEINEKFTFLSGMRSNIPVESQKHYFSSQLGLKYSLNSNHSFLLSGGKYHNYAEPNYYSKVYSLLESYQVALDYTFEIKDFLLKAATYFKNETGNQPVDIFFTTDKINTFGIECYIEYNFLKHFVFSFSNSFIDQKVVIFGYKYNGNNDLNYFIKSSLQFNNPKLFSVSLIYTCRPGTYYNGIVGSEFDVQTNLYKPVYSNSLYAFQYSNYNRFDISLTKYIKLKRNALIAFVTLNNLFNTKNELSDQYNFDYSRKYFDFYQLRTLYFGIVWQLSY